MSARKRRVEIFTAGCPVCDEAIKLVKKLACESCEIKAYDLNKSCKSKECIEKVGTYGIKRIPAVVVDGKLAECCKAGPVTIEGLKAAGLGVRL